jgi:hypothetical protein
MASGRAACAPAERRSNWPPFDPADRGLNRLGDVDRLAKFHRGALAFKFISLTAFIILVPGG